MNILLTSVGRRSYLVEFFREALARRGLVIAANSIAGTPGMLAADHAVLVPPANSVEYADVVLRLCKRHEIGLLCPCHDLDVLALSRLKPKLNAIGVVALVPTETWAERTLDKVMCGAFLSQAGFRTPRSVISADNVGTDSLLERGVASMIVKARYGYGSLGVRICRSDEELATGIIEAAKDVRDSLFGGFLNLPAHESVLIQEHVCGKEYCIGVLNDMAGSYVAHFVCEVYSMRGGESETATSVDGGPFASLARSLSEVTKHQGIWGVDVIVDDRGDIVIIDVNPRFTGDYAFHHTAGADVPAALLAWAEGHPLNASWLETRSGVRMYKGIVPKVAAMPAAGEWL